METTEKIKNLHEQYAKVILHLIERKVGQDLIKIQNEYNKLVEEYFGIKK